VLFFIIRYRYFIILNILSICCMNCGSGKMESSKQYGKVYYVYGDGSGNAYTVTLDSIVYSPISLEESSSGVYSGGQPWRKHISKEQWTALAALLDGALANTSLQQPQRTKGSSSIARFDEEGSPDGACIIKMGSKAQQEIEYFLHSL
jgi:hypothetical protein